MDERQLPQKPFVKGLCGLGCNLAGNVFNEKVQANLCES